jgi:hypothetical protein
MMSVAQIMAPASFCTPNATGMIAVGRGRDRGVAQARPLDVRSARAEQEAAEQRTGRRADRAEGIAARGDQPEPADRGAKVRGH